MTHWFSSLPGAVLAGCLVALAAVGGEPPPPADAAGLMQRLEQGVATLPEPPAGVLDDLGALQGTVSNLVAELESARRSEAAAHARMASWTAAILSRELKKISASERLIEITEKTGRTEEIARYRERHQRLLDSIDETAAHYESMVRHLGSLRPELVAFGFEQYQQHLVGKELAAQLGIHRVVRNQVDQYVESGQADLDAWKKELQDL